jgi:hypothetical protein
MAYDLHGVYAKQDKWVGPYLSSHTNLIEIKGGLDILWQSGIIREKVVLGGLAFYRRGFIASRSSCLEPGCTFESGTPAQLCSGEMGLMLNSEIDQITDEKGLQATLDKDAAVEILTFEDTHWVAYDDGETLQMKADFARSQCLGGVMAWAVSHDTKEAKYSQALAKAAPSITRWRPEHDSAAPTKYQGSMADGSDFAEQSDFCVSGKTYTTVAGDTCDSIALAHSTSSGLLRLQNPATILDCYAIPTGIELCLPASCEMTWTLQPGDTYLTIDLERYAVTRRYFFGSVTKFNRWIERVVTACT